jgi:hypothetical protein
MRSGRQPDDCFYVHVTSLVDHRISIHVFILGQSSPRRDILELESICFICAWQRHQSSSAPLRSDHRSSTSMKRMRPTPRAPLGSALDNLPTRITPTTHQGERKTTLLYTSRATLSLKGASQVLVAECQGEAMERRGGGQKERNMNSCWVRPHLFLFLL